MNNMNEESYMNNHDISFNMNNYVVVDIDHNMIETEGNY